MSRPGWPTKKGLLHLPNRFKFIPLIISTGVMAFMVWGAIAAISYPYYGFEFFPDWKISFVDPTGGFDKQIAVGDRLISIDGREVDVNLPLFRFLPPGQVITLEVARNDLVRVISYPLLEPPIDVLLSRATASLIAFIFWVSGVVIIYLKPKKIIAWLFFLITQSGCVVLTAGSLTTFGIYWSIFPYSISTFIVGAMSVHFHLYFPMPVRTQYNRFLLIATYFFAFFGGLVLSNMIISINPSSRSLELSSDAIRLSLLISFTVIILILIYGHRFQSTSETRGKTRVVTFGGIIGIVPLTFLSLLPDLLFGKPILAYEFSFIFLSILPISYTYSIFRYQIITINDRVSRSIIQVLNYVLVLAIYLGLLVLISMFTPPPILNEPVLLFLIIILLAALFSPTRKLLQRGLEKAFYGEGYDLSTIITKSSKVVSELKSLAALTEKLYSIIRTLHFSALALMIPDDKYYAPVIDYGYQPSELQQFKLPINGALAVKLFEQEQPIWNRQLKKLSSDQYLEKLEYSFLSIHSQFIIAPLSSKDEALGFLIISPDFDLEWATDQDLMILTTLSNMVCVALENVRLIESLSVNSDDTNLLRGKVLKAKQLATGEVEDEFQSIARELHDGPIQDLVGLGFDLAKMKTKSNSPEDRLYEYKIGSIIRELREICTYLRPPSLYLGVYAALQSLVMRFQEYNPSIQFHLEFKGEPIDLPGEINLAIYRITQESLNNIVQHSNANEAKVVFSFMPQNVQLTIQDNGIGFVIPENWFELASNGHLGVLGLFERVQSLQGNLEISSFPGKGTIIDIEAPLQQTNSSKEEE